MKNPLVRKIGNQENKLKDIITFFIQKLIFTKQFDVNGLSSYENKVIRLFD